MRLALLVPARNPRERLTAEDPGNAQWQRDLVVSCSKLATSAEQGAGVLMQADTGETASVYCAE